MYSVIRIQALHRRCKPNLGREVPSRQVNARMCNVLKVPEIGAGELINESPTRFTTHNGPNVS